MNRDLSEIITYYATKSHRELDELMVSKSKDNLMSCLNDLLTTYFNDKNSSTLREFITVSVAGYKHNPEKLGYNGFKHSSDIFGQAINCEAKPKNITTMGYDERKTKPKLNADGSFNDYTEKRLSKDKAANLNILSSGFIDGQLQYILEFPFSVIEKRMAKNLTKKVGPYLRSSEFTFSDYKDSNRITIIYKNIKAIKENERYFNKKLFKYLTEYSDV